MKKARTKKQKKNKKGTRYACDECGMVVGVVDPCGCADVCDLYCCGAPMKPVKSGRKTKRRS